MTTNSINPEIEESGERPDPIFKEVMAKALRSVALGTETSEMRVKQSTTADLLITIPPGSKLENTMFDFFRPTNVLEFKSARDRLTIKNFSAQMGRVYMWHEQTGTPYSDLLNIVVTAYTPQEVLDFSTERGSVFKQVGDREWLLEGRVGWQDVAIVLCGKLPIEPRYAPWLLFASPRSDTWHEFLKMVANNRDFDMLREAAKLNPNEIKREVRSMSSDLRKIINEFSPAEFTRLRTEWKEALPFWLDYLSDDLGDVLDVVPPEKRLAGLKPEDVLRGLKPEEKQQLLKLLLAEQQQPNDKQQESSATDKKKKLRRKKI